MKFKLIIDKNKDESIVAIVRQKTSLIDEIQALVENENKAGEITGYTEDDIEILKINEIECVYVENGKTYASYSNGNTYKLRHRLYEFESLVTDDFIKINKSALGNWKKIKKFSTALSGAVDVEFKGGHIDYVSRRCFAEIKRRYKL